MPPVLGILGLRETIAIGAWYIWWQRREAVKGERVISVTSTAFSIQTLTANFIRSSGTSRSKEIIWTKPPIGSYKMNVDATFFENGAGAAGAILRNHRGEALAGASWVLNRLLDPATAEATTVLKGLQLIDTLGCTPVTIETDCLVVAQACNGEAEVLGPYAAILMECFHKIRMHGSTKVSSKYISFLMKISFLSNQDLCARIIPVFISGFPAMRFLWEETFPSTTRHLW